MQFEFKPHFVNMLLKFTNVENAYSFLSYFEEVCSMMHFPTVPVDRIILTFRSFLEELGKKLEAMSSYKLYLLLE